MREIKFRGKRYYDKTWIYGSLLEDDIIVVKGATHIEEDYIGFNDEWCSVIKETVGQFTGFIDKNGKEIYEGDLLGNRYNKVEFSFGCFNINGDRPLSYSGCKELEIII